MSEEEEFEELEEFEGYEIPKVEGINVIDILRKYKKEEVVLYRRGSLGRNYITFLESKYPKRSRHPLNKYALTLSETIHSNKIKLKNVEEHNRKELEEEIENNEEELQKYYDELEIIFRLKEVYIESGNFSEDKKAELDDKYFHRIEESENINDIKKYYLTKLGKEDIKNINELTTDELNYLEQKYLNDFEGMDIVPNDEIRFIITEEEEFKCLDNKSKPYEKKLKVEYSFILNEDKIILESMEAGNGIEYISCYFNDIKYNDLISENIEQSYNIDDIDFIISDIFKNGSSSIFLEENKYDLSIASVFFKKFSNNQEFVDKVQQFIRNSNPPKKNIELLSLLAARSGDILLLKFLIINGYISNDTEKLFKLAFASGNAEIVYLVENIAITNKKKAVVGYEALEGACISRRLDLIKYLIENFNSTNSIFDDFNNIFCIEKMFKIFPLISDTRIFELLFNKIIDINSNEDIKKIIETAYFKIFEENESLEALQFIYSLKNIYTKLFEGQYELDDLFRLGGLEGLSNERLLFFSVDNLNIQATKFLVNRVGKEINSKIEGAYFNNGPNNTTSLILAIENSTILFLRKLEKVNFNINDSSRIPCCNHYVLERKNKIVKILLSNPEIDVNKGNEYYSLGSIAFHSPIKLAAGMKRKEMVEMLCAKGAKLEDHFSIKDNDIHKDSNYEERKYFVKHINEKYSNKQKEAAEINKKNQSLKLETAINTVDSNLMDETIKDTDIEEEEEKEEEKKDKKRSIGD